MSSSKIQHKVLLMLVPQLKSVKQLSLLLGDRAEQDVAAGACTHRRHRQAETQMCGGCFVCLLVFFDTQLLNLQARL